MNKTLVTLFSAVALTAACSAPLAAQNSTAAKGAKAEKTTQQEVNKDEKPKPASSWDFTEEDWWALRFRFSDALHQARVDCRTRHVDNAAYEVERAASWLKYAEDFADEDSAEELASAQAELTDYAKQLRHGKQVNARLLESAFAHASSALARYHDCKSNKALAERDLKTAGQHLFAATNHLREAACSANFEFGDEFVEFYVENWPYGYWDETVTFEKNKVESNLKIFESELESLLRGWMQKGRNDSIFEL